MTIFEIIYRLQLIEQMEIIVGQHMSPEQQIKREVMHLRKLIENSTQIEKTLK